MTDPLSSDPVVALVAADASAMAELRPARDILDGFAVSWKERILAAVESASFDANGLRAVIVASADALLPAAVAAATGLPVIRVPVPDAGRAGIDLLCDAATENLPAGGVAFATVAIGEAGAKNAALFVVSVLGLTDARLGTEWIAFRQRQTNAVLGLPPLTDV